MGYYGNVCLIIHIVPFFILTNFEIWVYKENVWIKRHIVPFYSYKFWNMSIHRKYVNKKTYSSFYSYNF